MTWLLAAAWLLPLLLAALAHRERLWWTPALGPVPALAAALLVPVGARLEIPWLLLGSRLGLDETGRLFLAFTAILWLAAGLYAAQSLRDQPHAGRFRAYFLLAMAGNLWLILAQDLVSFYTGFSLMGLASYGLVIHHGDREALRAGRVYLAMTLVGELALFSALVLIAAQTGTLTPSPEQLVDLRGLTIGLLLFGLAIKAGLVPLHVWLPLAHPAAPVPASAVLSGTMIKVALLGWLRFLPVGQVALPEWGMLLLFAGLITLFFAIPVGLVQSDPKVVLAYSSVSKMGLLTLTLGLILLDPALAPAGVLALILYAAHHALAKGGLFLGVGLRHYAAAQPLILAGLALLALSLAGAPPSGGAVAKYGIKPALTDTGWSWLGGAVTLAAISTTLLMARFLWIIWRIEPHPAKGYVWGAAAWGGLILLVLLYPLVLGSPSAWISDAGPIGIGIGIAGLMALVAWRKPRLLRPLVGLIGPGDLLALVRPILAVLKLLARTLWRGWVWFLEWALSALRGALAPLEPQARDPERRLRAWPTAGSAWLVITVLLLVLLLTATPQGPPIETTPTPAAVTRVEAEPATTQDAAESGAAVPETTRQPGVILIDEPPLPTPGAEPGTTAPERPEMREMPPPVPTPVPEAAAAVPVADCDTQDRLVLRHRAVAQPLELAPCVRDQGIPRQGAAPPLTNRLVELVQHHLKDLGYAPGPLDGLIGPRTLDAVRRFQRNQGLADTGVISFDLLKRIQSANPGALDRADPGPDPGPGMGTPDGQRSP